MEEERLEIIDVEKLNKEIKSDNRWTNFYSAFLGLEIFAIAAGITRSIAKKDAGELAWLLLYIVLAVTHGASSHIYLMNNTEKEEKIRRKEQEEYKLINVESLKDSVKKEKIKTILFSSLGGIGFILSACAYHYGLKNDMPLVGLGGLGISCLSGFLLKKADQAYLRKDSYEEDIYLVKG